MYVQARHRETVQAKLQEMFDEIVSTLNNTYKTFRDDGREVCITSLIMHPRKAVRRPLFPLYAVLSPLVNDHANSCGQNHDFSAEHVQRIDLIACSYRNIIQQRTWF